MIRQMAPTLDGIRADHVERYKWAAAFIQRAGFATVLDIGCGVGYGAWLMAQTGASITAIDADPDAITYARDHYAHPAASYRVASADDFDGAPRGVAVAFEVIEHAPEVLALLARLRTRVLLGSVPNEAVTPYRAGASHPDHYRHFTVDQLRDALLAAGWRVSAVYGQRGKTGAEACVTPWSDDARTIIFSAVRDA